MSELGRRAAFAIIAAPVSIVVVYIGGLPFAILLGVIAGLATWEFYRIARAAGSDPISEFGVPLAAATPILAWVYSTYGIHTPAALSLLALMTLFSVSIWARGVDGRPISAISITVLGVLYTGATIAFGFSLRNHVYVRHAPAAGTALVVLPMMLTWASDTGGYFAGRAFGRHKLIPAVSPSKTVEGALGALLLTVVICWAYTRWILQPNAAVSMPPWAVIVFGLAISVAAQMGDLFESLIKREAGVKDSSGIIPGHGGVLDRFDSMFFVLPVAYLLLSRFLIFAP